MNNMPKDQQQEILNFVRKFNPSWISNGFTEETIHFAEEFGKYCQNKKLSSTQLRNIFGELKNIQLRLLNNEFDKERGRILLMRAKMAYAVARDSNSRNNNSRNKIMGDFQKIFELAHKEIKDIQTFNRFVDFFTAIIAYHKAAGGK